MVYTTYKNGALEDGLLLFYPHIYIYVYLLDMLSSEEMQVV